MENIRALIITKYFPPDLEARSLQIGKVSHAMMRNQCEVLVVAGLKDECSRAESVQNEKLSNLVQYVPYKQCTKASTFIGRVWKRLALELNSSNPRNRWVDDAFAAALQLIKGYAPHVLVTSSMPFDSHLVGLQLKKCTNIPWVASFSDPWPPRICLPPYDTHRIPVFEQWQMLLLRRVLNSCDAVHMPNRQALELMESASRISIKSKAWAIPHIGSKITYHDDESQMGWLTHIGAFTRERVSPSLLDAVKITARKIPNQFKGLLLVGFVCPELRSLIKKMKLEPYVRISGSVSQDKAMSIAANSSALLVIEANMPMSPFLPSKFADYAQVGRPIIALTPQNSPIRDYLNTYGGGCAVSHNVDEISRAFESVFSDSMNAAPSARISNNCTLGDIFSGDTVAERYLDMFRTLQKERINGSTISICNEPTQPVFSSNLRT